MMAVIYVPPNNSAEPTRLAAQNGHLPCPAGCRKVKRVPSASMGGSPTGVLREPRGR